MHSPQVIETRKHSDSHYSHADTEPFRFEPEATKETAPKVLSAGQWLRVVMGFEAPFGHDGLPTVWG